MPFVKSHAPAKISRNERPTIQHKNLLNKRGASYLQQRMSTRSRKARQMKNYEDVGPHSKMFKHDTIIVGHPPKLEIVLSGETRYTIPNSPKNGNIFEQTCVRQAEILPDVLSEIRSFHKIHSFAIDTDHEIELID